MIAEATRPRFMTDDPDDAMSPAARRELEQLIASWQLSDPAIPKRSNDDGAGDRPHAGSPAGVLLVEDNPADALLVREALLDAGADEFRLVHAERMQTALQMLDTGSFRLVLLDLSLPDGDGLDTLVRFRMVAPHLPVVVLTGLDDHAVAMAALRYGAQDYLPKGRMTSDVLVRVIRFSLERSRLLASEQAARAQAERALAQVEAALATRDRFLAMASHELRTPLTALHGFSQILVRGLSRGADLERITEAAAHIETQTKRLKRLIGDLLDASRLVSEDFSIQQDEQDLSWSIRMAASIVRGLYPDRTIDLDVADSLPAVRGDGERLEQLFINLIANACKYSMEPAPVRVRARIMRSELQIAVTDEGIGISLEDQAAIFDRFHRAAEVEQQVAGWGLGLYIASQIVRLHNGSIAVESEPGRGSTFTVRLPRSGTKT
jgi:signal transduction histidine kinase